MNNCITSQNQSRKQTHFSFIKVQNILTGVADDAADIEEAVDDDDDDDGEVVMTDEAEPGKPFGKMPLLARLASLAVAAAATAARLAA